MAKKKRGRVSRSHTKKNAQQGSGGGNNWMNLPSGVKEWAVEKPGSYLLDIVPYEVTDKNHLDDIDVGNLWYKRMFMVHHGVGAQERSIVCPRSIHKKCPMCDEMDKLKADDYDKHEAVITDLRPQKFVAFNMLDPEDDEKQVVFCMTINKFCNVLTDELDAEEESMMDFYQAVDGGHTIKARFSKATHKGRDFMQCGKIDFKPRDDLDEDAVIDNGVCLDDMLVVLDYKKIKDMHLQIDDEDDEEPEEEAPEEEEEKPKSRSRSRKKSSKKPPPKEEEPEEDPEEEDDDDGHEDGGREDGDDEVPECPQCNEEFEKEDGEDDGTYLFCTKKCMRKYKEAQEEKEEEEPEEEEEKPKASKKKSSKKKTSSKKSSSKDGPKCPEGGEWGKDTDKFDPGCDDCPHWDTCDAENRK